MIQQLLSSPELLIVWLAVILISITVHEFSHALAGSLKGDATAEEEGRLTLNPLAHIDPVGFFMLIVLGFGWAKPVPYNPYNLKNPIKDAVHIALAGPFSNLVLAVLSGLILRGLMHYDVIASSSLLALFLFYLTLVNLFLMLFNILPVYPLDGSKLVDAVLVKPHQQKLRNQIAYYSPRVLLALVVLSMLTSIDVFSFISIPAIIILGIIIGPNALMELNLI